MPLQYPQSSPYNPYSEPKAPANWPLIILIALGIIILILAVIFVIIPYFSEQKGTGDNNDNGEGIAVGEPNPSTPICDRNVYNCGNFTTQAEAQVIFDACFKTAGDIHGLDKDGNGKACESLG